MLLAKMAGTCCDLAQDDFSWLATEPSIGGGRVGTPGKSFLLIINNYEVL